MKMETYPYKVKKVSGGKNDCLWDIMAREGFDPKDWKKVYEAPYNRAFKKKNPNPDVIQPGDVLYLPKYKKSEIKKAKEEIKEKEKKAGELKKRRNNLKKSVDKLDKDKKKRQKQIKEITKEVKQIEEIEEACYSDGDPLAAGFCDLKFAKKRRGLTQDLKVLQDVEDDQQIQSLLKRIHVKLDDADKGLSKALAELTKARQELEKMEKSPY